MEASQSVSACLHSGLTRDQIDSFVSRNLTGCDMEVCPKCGGQLISCGCLNEDEEDEDVD